MEIINLILQNWRKVWFWLLGWTQCYNQAWSSPSWSWNGCQQTAKRQCQKENHKPWWHPLLHEAAQKIGSTGKTFTCTETKLNFFPCFNFLFFNYCFNKWQFVTDYFFNRHVYFLIHSILMPQREENPEGNRQFRLQIYFLGFIVVSWYPSPWHEETSEFITLWVINITIFKNCYYNMLNNIWNNSKVTIFFNFTALHLEIKFKMEDKGCKRYLQSYLKRHKVIRVQTYLAFLDHIFPR